MSRFRTVARAPLPECLPGEFFVLVCSRDSNSFTLYLDDAEGSSFALGSNVEQIMRGMRNMQLDPDVVDQSIDIAREFGGAQTIWSEPRVIPLKPETKQRSVFDAQEQDNARQYVQLPADG